MPLPTLTPVGEFLYAVLEPYAHWDADNSYATAHFCNAIGKMFEEINLITRDSEAGVGWSILVDIDRAPEKFFEWVAQFVGAALVPGLGELEQRQKLKSVEVIRRGRPDTVVEVAKLELTGSKTVYLQERNGSAARTTVTTLAGETPNPAALLAAILRQKPIGDLFFTNQIVGGDFNTLNGTHATFAEVITDFTDFDDVLSDPSQT